MADDSYHCPFPSCKLPFKGMKGLRIHFNSNEDHRSFMLDNNISLADLRGSSKYFTETRQLPSDQGTSLERASVQITEGNPLHSSPEVTNNHETDIEDSTSACTSPEMMFPQDDDGSVDVTPADDPNQGDTIKFVSQDGTVCEFPNTQRGEVLLWLYERGNQGEAANEWLLSQYIQSLRNKENVVFEDNVKAEIELLSLLNQASVPVYLFDSIVKFLKRWVATGKYRNFRPREKVMENLEELTHMDIQQPKESSVLLPNIGKSLNVSTFDVKAVLYDLLTSPILDKDDQYLFKGESPLDPPDPKPARLNDFDTGERYIQSFHKLQETPMDLPLPLVFFIDKAAVTWNGRLSVEAVMMQLGIHNRETRYMDESFRNLGMIPRLDRLGYSSSQGLQKMKDYHVVLDHIFAELKSIMEGGGLLWMFRYKEKFFRVNLKPYILCINGDYPGHNMICGKFGGGFNVQFKCRTCLCPSDKLEDPTNKWPRILGTDYVSDLCSEDYLSRNYSMHFIDNAIEKLEYGICPEGVCGLCLGEIVHVIQGGEEERLHEGIVNHTIVSDNAQLKAEANRFACRVASGWYGVRPPVIKVKRWIPTNNKKRHLSQMLEESSSDGPPPATEGEQTVDEHNSTEESGDESEDIDSESDDEAANLIPVPHSVYQQTQAVIPLKKKRQTSILGGVTGKRVDELSRKLGRMLQQQSDRDLPPCYFAKGIVNDAMTTSSERQGLLLLLLLIFCSTYGKQRLSQRFGKEKLAYMIESIEYSICFEELCKDKRGFPRDLIESGCFEQFLEEKMQLFRYVAARNTGDGLNLVKLHMIQHTPEQCLALGSPANISGGPGEKNQKVQKNAARRTQMNLDTLDFQQSRKMLQAYTVKTAAALVEQQTAAFSNLASDASASSTSEHYETDGDLAELYCCHYQLEIIGGRAKLIHTGLPQSTRAKVLKSQDWFRGKDTCLSKATEVTEAIVHKAKSIVTQYKKQHRNRNPPDTQIPVFAKAVIPKRDEPFMGLGHDSDGSRTIYWADPVKVKRKKKIASRNDWGFFRWETLGEIPAKLLCFVECEKQADSWFFDSAGLESEVGQNYVFLHSLSKEPSTYLDVTSELDLSDMQHPASKLVFRGELEMDPNRRTKPLVTLLPLSLLTGPAIVIGDFDPQFKGRGSQIHKMLQQKDPGHEHIVLRRRRQWSDVFQALCQDTFGQVKRVMPKVVFE